MRALYPDFDLGVSVWEQTVMDDVVSGVQGGWR